MVFPEQTHKLSDGRTLLLRPPVTGDAAACIDFLKAVGGETDYLLCDGNGIPGLTAEAEEAYLAASRVNPAVAMFLGFVDKVLVTVFDVRPAARPRIAHNATISLAVREAYWRLGIGSIAMQTMIAYAKGTGTLETLNLDVNASNTRAIRLYERFGFAVVGRHKNRIRIGEARYDELLMDLELLKNDPV